MRRKPCSTSSSWCRAYVIGLLSAWVWTGHSGTLVWTNVTGGNWSNPKNWDPGGVPGPGDIAKITTGGSYTVTDDQNTTVAGIIVGNALPATGVQHLVVPAGVILTATGPITVNDNGTFTVASGGTVDLANTAPLHLVGPGANSGTINLTNHNIYLYNDGTTANQGGLVNHAGGRINLNGSGGIVSALGPQDFFQNQGEVSKLAGTGTSLLAASVGLLGGTYTAAAGTIVQLGGGVSSAPLSADPSLVLNSPGQFQFVSGFLIFPANVIPGLVLRGGLLQLGSGFQGGSIASLALDGINLTNTLPVTGSLVITNGSVSGVFQVANGGLLTAYAVTFNAQVTVAAGGRFVVQSGTASFGNGSSTDSRLTVQNGANLDVAGTLTLDGPLINSGTVNLTNGTSIQAYNNTTTAYAGALVNLPTGVINLWNNSSLYGLARGNEYLLNEGAINLLSGTAQSTIDFSYLENDGMLAAQHGTLLLQSGAGEFLSSQILAVTLNSASDYGKISIVGQAPLNGLFKVSLGNGYVPPFGASFSVVSYGSFVGGFSGFSYPSLPSMAVWRPTYGTSALTLQVQPALSSVSSGTGLAMQVDGMPGHQAILLTSTNSASPLADWTPLSTNTFDLTGYLSLTNNLLKTERQRFFTFQLP